MRKILFMICASFSTNFAIADSIDINWLNEDGTTYLISTCETGDELVLPVAPTKYGYTFVGWKYSYDMSTLDTSINGIRYYGFNASGNCRYMDTRTNMPYTADINCNDSNFSDLTNRQWKVFFSYGTVYGESMCSDTPGQARWETGHPTITTSTSNMCWCRLTGFIPISNNVLYDPAVSPWAYYVSHSSASECASNCANQCGANARYFSSFRDSLYGVNN